jgi:ribosomal protein L37E
MSRNRVTNADRNASASQAGKASRPGGERAGAGHQAVAPRPTGSAPLTECQKSGSVPSPGRDVPMDPRDTFVCLACGNISVHERDGTLVCRHCGYTRTSPAS